MLANLPADICELIIGALNPIGQAYLRMSCKKYAKLPYANKPPLDDVFLECTADELQAAVENGLLRNLCGSRIDLVTLINRQDDETFEKMRTMRRDHIILLAKWIIAEGDDPRLKSFLCAMMRPAYRESNLNSIDYMLGITEFSRLEIHYFIAYEIAKSRNYTLDLNLYGDRYCNHSFLTFVIYGAAVLCLPHKLEFVQVFNHNGMIMCMQDFITLAVKYRPDRDTALLRPLFAHNYPVFDRKVTAYKGLFAGKFTQHEVWIYDLCETDLISHPMFTPDVLSTFFDIRRDYRIPFRCFGIRPEVFDYLVSVGMNFMPYVRINMILAHNLPYEPAEIGIDWAIPAIRHKRRDLLASVEKKLTSDEDIEQYKKIISVSEYLGFL